MIKETINLKTIYKNLKHDVYLDVFALANYTEFHHNEYRNAVLLLPGGAYSFISQRENEPVVMKLLSENIVVFSLKYTTGPYIDELYPLIEGYASLDYIRNNKDKYHVDTNNIYVFGFSAGGHFSLSLGAHQKEEKYAKVLDTQIDNLKVNGIVVAYPVVSMDEKITHKETMENITHKNQTLIEYHSIEKHIDKDYPKTFIFVCDEDDIVDPIHSIILASELKRNNVKMEFHYYAKGHHGVSLANEVVNDNKEDIEYSSYFKNWIDLALNFIKNS
ncbi:MAG: alpha/beta hydrolase [Bacilli bacterium]